MKLYEFYSDWLEHDGEECVIDGEKCKIKVSVINAIYPFEHKRVDVSAEIIDKTSERYLESKRKLGDDWSYDVLGTLELECEVLEQLI